MEGKKHIGFISGGNKDPLDEVMIYTVTDESKLNDIGVRAIAGVCKNAIFISLTTELFYVYKDGAFKLIVPKHLNLWGIIYDKIDIKKY